LGCGLTSRIFPGNQDRVQIVITLSVFHRIDFQPGHGQGVGQLIVGKRDISTGTYSFNQLKADFHFKIALKICKSLSKNMRMIIYSVFQHGNPFNTHAECKSGIFAGVISDIFKHCRVDHSGSQHFQPAGVRTDPAPLPRHMTQRISTSALGSVNGKKLGRKRRLICSSNIS
jgi:hypothetical protein